jgi:hypothetical protein
MVPKWLISNVIQPEWIPILSLTFSPGLCGMVKLLMVASKWRAIEAISPACFVPLATGRPDTTMYASPIVSTWTKCYKTFLSIIYAYPIT